MATDTPKKEPHDVWMTQMKDAVDSYQKIEDEMVGLFKQSVDYQIQLTRQFRKMTFDAMRIPQ